MDTRAEARHLLCGVRVLSADVLPRRPADGPATAALARLEESAGLPLTTVSVAWVLANPAITSAIIGASRPDQLDATLAAASLTLDPQLKARLDEATAEYRRGDAQR